MPTISTRIKSDLKSEVEEVFKSWAIYNRSNSAVFPSSQATQGLAF
jgi:hypothetical protein